MPVVFIPSKSDSERSIVDVIVDVKSTEAAKDVAVLPSQHTRLGAPQSLEFRFQEAIERIYEVRSAIQGGIFGIRFWEL